MRKRRPYWVSLVDARENNPFTEEDGGRWVTFCQHHSQFVQHPRKADATGWAREPEQWCEGCRTLAHVESTGVTIATIP